MPYLLALTRANRSRYCSTRQTGSRSRPKVTHIEAPAFLSVNNLSTVTLRASNECTDPYYSSVHDYYCSGRPVFATFTIVKHCFTIIKGSFINKIKIKVKVITIKHNMFINVLDNIPLLAPCHNPRLCAVRLATVV